MRNKITDLNNILFAQLERLDDESIKGDELAREIARARAMAGVASQIIQGGALLLNAWVAAERNLEDGALPEMLEGRNADEAQSGTGLIPYGQRKRAHG